MRGTKQTLRNISLGLSLAGFLAAGAAAQDTAQPADASGNGQNPASAGTAAGGGASAAVSAADRNFVMKAAQGGLAEVQLGQLAAEKASNEDVKKFGQRMADDHAKANDQLKQLAASKNIAVPTQPSAKEKADADRLTKLSGEAFDHAYMREMVKDHMKDVAEFKRQSKSGKDGDIRNFASQTLPTLQDHLSSARSLVPRTAAASGDKAGEKPSPAKPMR